MAIVLRPYQEEAVEFLLSKERAILADQMGVGKSFPAVEAALRLTKWHGASGPNLVVCPAYLVPQWVEVIRTYARIADDDAVIALNRSDPPVPQGEDAPLWVVTSYHGLMDAGVAKHPELVRRKWGVVVFDEAHRLRGRNSQWTKNAYRIKADRVWMLTGTPIVNNPGDVYPLLHLCDRKKFSSYWDFVSEWCVLDRTPWKTEPVAVRKGREKDFYALLDPYIMRRMVEDVLPELPPVTDVFVPVDLPKATKQAHDKAKKDWFIEHPDLTDRVIATSGGALVHNLRALTAGTLPLKQGGKPPAKNPKVEAVVGLVEDHPEPMVVFAWYKDTAGLIAGRIEHRPVFLLTGDMSPARRAKGVEEWKRSPDGVIVATIEALQEGANLQHARTVVFAEHHYLPASIEQAVARVRRLGQGYPVTVYHVMCRGTVDEAVYRVQARREKNVRRALIEDLRDEGSPASWGKLVTALVLMALIVACASVA